MVKTILGGSASAILDPKTPPKDSNRARDPKNRRSPLSAPAVVTASGKHVFLVDWWLLKAKGKGLAVGGVDSRETLGVRGFSSTTICKRHAANVLETEDGIMITVTGFLNRSRTHDNGFPCELYNHFLHGFPNDWEYYAASVSGEDSADIGASMRNSPYLKFKMASGNNGSHSLSLSSDDLPFTTACDIMMLSFGESHYRSLAKDIFSDILKTAQDTAFQPTGSSIDAERENSTLVQKVGSGTSETPTQQEVHGHKGMITNENAKSSPKSMRGRCIPTRPDPPCTRSRSRTGIPTPTMVHNVDPRTTKTPTDEKVRVQNDKDMNTDDIAKDSQKSVREAACAISKTRSTDSTPCPMQNADSGTTDTPSMHKNFKVQDDINMITNNNAKGSQKSAWRRGRRTPTHPEPLCTRSKTRRITSTLTIMN